MDASQTGIHTGERQRNERSGKSTGRLARSERTSVQRAPSGAIEQRELLERRGLKYAFHAVQLVQRPESLLKQAWVDVVIEASAACSSFAIFDCSGLKRLAC